MASLRRDLPWLQAMTAMRLESVADGMVQQHHHHRALPPVTLIDRDDPLHDSFTSKLESRSRRAPTYQDGGWSIHQGLQGTDDQTRQIGPIAPCTSPSSGGVVSSCPLSPASRNSALFD